MATLDMGNSHTCRLALSPFSSAHRFVLLPAVAPLSSSPGLAEGGSSCLPVLLHSAIGREGKRFN